MTKPSISLCMIVKNEEKFLGQCLESVKNVVDEMIIVDTGSTDRTVEIAENFGAKVYHHAWRNDFSEARNYGLQFATGDWILQLDADEALESDDIELVRAAVKSDQYSAVYVAIYSTISGKPSKHYFPRIFRRGKAHFHGIVHNQLIVDGTLLHSEIRVYHYGYDLSREEMLAKYERSEKLLLRQIEADPDDLFAWHNLIRIHRNQFKYDQALEESERVLHRLGSQKDRPAYLEILYDAADCAGILGDFKRAEQFCLAALEIKPDYIDAIYVLGSVYKARGDYFKALKKYSIFLNMLEKMNERPDIENVKLCTFGNKVPALQNMAACFMNLNKKEKAIEYLEESLRFDPDSVITQLSLARLYFETEKMKPALDRYERVFANEPGNLEALQGIIHVRLALGNSADHHVLTLLKNARTAPDVLRTVADMCARYRDFTNAARLYTAYMQSRPNDLDALQNLCVCYSELGHYRAAIAGYKVLIENDPFNAVVLKNINLIKRKMQQAPTSIAS